MTYHIVNMYIFLATQAFINLALLPFGLDDFVLMGVI